MAFSLRKKLLEEIEEKRGLISRSAYVEDLLKKALRGQDATFVPPPLRDAKISHLASRNPETRVEYLEGSVVRPAQDAVGGPAPYTIYSDREFRGRADESTPGSHWFNPRSCHNCRILLEDFPRG